MLFLDCLVALAPWRLTFYFFILCARRGLLPVIGVCLGLQQGQLRGIEVVAKAIE